MSKHVLVLVGILAAGGAALAAAQQGPAAERPRGLRGPRGGMDPAEMKQELGLSDAQVAQIRKLHVDQRKATIKRRADAQLARIELQELMQAPTVDEKAVALRVKELSDIQAANIKGRVDTMLAMKKILTPEQQEKMKQLHRARMQGPRMGPDGQRPGMMRRRMAPPPREGEDNPPSRESLDPQLR